MLKNHEQSDTIPVEMNAYKKSRNPSSFLNAKGTNQDTIAFVAYKDV
jgi:hypothetical protein